MPEGLEGGQPEAGSQIMPRARRSNRHIGPAFLRASPHAEIPIAERRHRFGLSHEFGMERLFDDIPLVGRVVMGWRPEAFVMDHPAVPRTTGWGIGLAAYIDTSSVAPTTRLPVAAAIRISIPSPSTNIACTVRPDMRIATDLPFQHTRNDRLCH
jgi:hypothetical protein